MTVNILSYEIDDLSTDQRRGLVKNWRHSDHADNPLLPAVEKLSDLLDEANDDADTAEESLSEYDNRIWALKDLLPDLVTVVDGIRDVIDDPASAGRAHVYEDAAVILEAVVKEMDLL